MSYIFVGGSQRSGTTLLTECLCSGSETNPYIGESGSLRALLQVHTMMEQRFEDESKLHFGSRPAMDEYFGSCLRLFLSHTLATNKPAESLVLKEPHLTMYFPLLARLLPAAKFVMSVRDPRDVVTSMLRVGEKLKDQGKSHLFNSGNIPQIARSVQKFYAPVINLANSDSKFKAAVCWVKYEDLVAAPEQEIAKLRQFTGLKLEGFDPDDHSMRTHEGHVASRAEDQRITPWISGLMKEKGVRASSVGRYRDKLSKKQIGEIEQTLKKFMNIFGYASDA